MKSRRDFIKKAGALSIALPLMGAGIGCKGETKMVAANAKETVKEAIKSGFTLDEFGIQLWSVRDFMEKDAKGTLKALGEYGYNSIESFQGEKALTLPPTTDILLSVDLCGCVYCIHTSSLLP